MSNIKEVYKKFLEDAPRGINKFSYAALKMEDLYGVEWEEDVFEEVEEPSETYSSDDDLAPANVPLDILLKNIKS